MVDERRNVAGHQPDVDRSIDVSGAAVSLQVDGDDMVALCEQRQDGPEHLARPESAMQQDERPPAPMSLVIEVDAVDLGVLAGALRLCGPIAGHGHAPCVNEKWVQEIGLRRRWEFIGARRTESSNEGGPIVAKHQATSISP